MAQKALPPPPEGRGKKPVERQVKGAARTPTRQCTGHSKSRNGERCTQPAMPNSDKCYYHGGATPSGAASPHFVHGKRSKFADVVPARFQGALQTALADPELLNLSEEVAAIQMRERELWMQMDTGEHGSLWKRAKELCAEYRDALAARDIPRLNDTMNELTRTIETGANQSVIWNELIATTLKKGRVAEVERRRRKDLQTSMDVEMLAYIIGYIDSSLRRHVSDPMEKAAVGGDLKLLVADIRARVSGGGSAS